MIDSRLLGNRNQLLFRRVARALRLSELILMIMHTFHCAVFALALLTHLPLSSSELPWTGRFRIQVPAEDANGHVVLKCTARSPFNFLLQLNTSMSHNKSRRSINHHHTMIHKRP